jgi:response regulator RpfG family c-di-GMP phosphodiesterase
MVVPKYINFLIIDDYFSIRKAVKQSLRNLEFAGEIFEADSIERAIDILSLKESSTKIQFIISDLQMPGGTGIEFLRFIRKNKQLENLPFLMLSGVNDKSLILEAISSGVSGYLFKPWNDETIKARIDSCWLKHVI